MTSIWDLANPQFRDLIPYQPGKPIEETARELGFDAGEIIKLASNENPLGPSPKAMAAVRQALPRAHLYPEGDCFCLRKALAAKLGFSPQNLIVGNGSNELLEFIGHAFLKPGDEVLVSQYAFVVYKLIAASFGACTVEVPSTDYRQSLEEMAACITPKTRIMFVPNPNNPTGTLVSQKAINQLMARVPDTVIVVFDEAYFEFLDRPPDTLRFIREGQNAIVLRTFSKIHGLAGLRIGYAVAPEDLVQILHKTKQPFNVNSIAQIAALAALEDEDHLRATKRLVDEGRHYLQKEFAKMKIPFVPATANFIMANVGDGREIFEKLLRKKIIVRPLKGYDLPEWIRISVGTMEENAKLIVALREVLAAQRGPRG